MNQNHKRGICSAQCRSVCRTHSAFRVRLRNSITMRQSFCSQRAPLSPFRPGIVWNHVPTFRQFVFRLMLASLIMIAACGNQNSTTPPIVVTFTPGFTPPATLGTQSPGNTTGIAATITNGPQNALVNWSVTCGSEPNCGSFGPASTASTIPTTYTSPTSIPSGGTVTVTATSANDSTKSVSASITIN